ncbi:hypothetical protein PLICRDRAFT_177744 [Plicaturopsis crispa FD-325 SS-3]|nr:hypothetical protein PLICRDRAFT_177744 [Plicaturopsis crispa FD-325 SS-3]
MPSPQSVLVVGAGPAGLVAALNLAQNGVPVRIIDKDRKYFIGQRGALVAPRTLEAYKILGVLPQILVAAGPVLPMRQYALPEGKVPVKTWPMIEAMDPTPAIPIAIPVILGQAHAQRILRDKLGEYGVSVELGVELRSFTQDAEKVVAQLVKTTEDGKETPETATYNWIVGTDGGHSVVRKQLGLPFIGESLQENFVIGDIRLTGLDHEYFHMWLDKDLTVGLRPTENADKDDMFAFAIRGQDVDYDKCATDYDALWECLIRKTGRTDLVFKEVVCAAHWRPNIRMVRAFNSGRALVAGDAAHVHSLTGGQGMNSSVLDSMNLGWKLSLVAKGLAPASLLDTYTDERVPVLAEMLNLTTALLGGALSGPVDDVSPWVRGKLLYQLGVNYRWSGITLDADALSAGEDVNSLKARAYGGQGNALGRVRAGEGARDAPALVDVRTGAKTSVYEILNVTRHTAFVLHGVDNTEAILGALGRFPEGTVETVLLLPKGSESGAPAEGADRVLVDSEGHAWATFAGEVQVGAVIVRPDSFVGAVVRDAAAVDAYLKGIFGHD